MRLTVICEAQSFGYGPISKLLVVARQLAKEGLRLVLMGSTTSLELAEQTPYFEEIVIVNTDSEEEIRRCHALMRNSEAVVTVMNPVVARVTRQLPKPLVVLDSLFWKWDSIPEDFRHAHLYCIQNFIGVPQRLEEEGNRIDHPQLVGPIIEPSLAPSPFQPDRMERLLVNFGGFCASSVTADANSTYPLLVTSLLLQSRLLSQFQEIVFVSCAATSRLLHEHFGSSRARFATLSHDDMLKALVSSNLLLTSPGLTTTLEAFMAGVPTVFLPPQNYSQYWILKKLRQQELAPVSYHWDDLPMTLPVSERMERAAGIKLVLKGLEYFGNSQQAQHDFIRTYESVLDADLAKLREAQHSFAASLGSNGVVTVVQQIKDLIGS